MQVFLAVLRQEEQKIRKALTEKAPLEMTDKDWKFFHTAKTATSVRKALCATTLEMKWSFGALKQENITEKRTGTQKL